MKYLMTSIILLCFFASCNSQQSDAKKMAGGIKAAVEENTPGTIPTKGGGWTMTAKIDGNDWVASSIMPPDPAGRIVGYHKKEYIGLPYDRRDMYLGKKIKFGENNAVDLAHDDEIGIWGGRKGAMEITKVEGNWVEGKFYFTGSTSQGSDKTIEVTEGFFRISLAKQP